MCFDGALRFVVFWASNPCSTGISSSGFFSSWLVLSRSFYGAGVNSALKPTCMLRAAYLVR